MTHLRTLALLALVFTSPALAARVTVPGTTVSVDVPAGFVSMPADVKAIKYPRGAPPATVYSAPGSGWSANVAFEVKNIPLRDVGLSSMLAAMVQSFEKMPGLGLRWVRHGLVRSGGREWIDLAFWVDGQDMPIYNHMRLTPVGDKALYVTANVGKAFYSKPRLGVEKG